MCVIKEYIYREREREIRKGKGVVIWLKENGSAPFSWFLRLKDTSVCFSISLEILVSVSGTCN